MGVRARMKAASAGWRQRGSCEHGVLVSGPGGGQRRCHPWSRRGSGFSQLENSSLWMFPFHMRDGRGPSVGPEARPLGCGRNPGSAPRLRVEAGKTERPGKSDPALRAASWGEGVGTGGGMG